MLLLAHTAVLLATLGIVQWVRRRTYTFSCSATLVERRVLRQHNLPCSVQSDKQHTSLLPELSQVSTPYTLRSTGGRRLTMHA